MGNEARNFFLNAAIVDSADESRVNLWLWEEDDASNAEAFDLSDVGGLPIIQDLSIEQEEGGYYTISATLVPTFEQAIPLLESSLFEQGNWLEVEWGYITSDGEIKSPLYKGQLALPEIQLGGETTITLKTEAIYAFSAARQTSTREPFNDMTRLDIMEEVLKGGDPPRLLFIDYDEVEGESLKKLTEDKISAIQGGMTDMAFARRLALECSCTLTITTKDGKDKVYLKDYETTASAKPTRLFRLMPYGGIYQPTPEGVYPAFTVSSSSMYVFLPADTARGVTAPSVDEETREQKMEKLEVAAQEAEQESAEADQFAEVNEWMQKKFGPKKSKQKKGGGAPKPTPQYPGRKEGAGGKTTMRDPNEGRNKDQAQGSLTEKSAQNTINLTIESVGVPDLLPGEVVGFEGAGTRFDGNFRVMRFTHGLSSSGPNSSIDLLRNAHFSSEDRVQEKAETNEQDAVTTEADDTVDNRERGGE